MKPTESWEEEFVQQFGEDFSSVVLIDDVKDFIRQVIKEAEEKAVGEFVKYLIKETQISSLKFGKMDFVSEPLIKMLSDERDRFLEQKF